MPYIESSTLCWGCKKAYCGCSWSKDLIPVKGWLAIYNPVAGEESYIVVTCPKYEKDIRRPEPVKLIPVVTKPKIDKETFKEEYKSRIRRAKYAGM